MVFDRRHHPRQSPHSDVYVDLAPNNGGWLSNISEGGLALHPFIPVVSGEAVRLVFDLPGTRHRIEASCQIAWTDKVRLKAGLRFLDLPEASHQRIREWVSAQTLSLKERLAGLLVGAVALCGLAFAFVYIVSLGESSSSHATPSADKQTVSPSDIPAPLMKPPETSGTDWTLSPPLIPKGAVVLQVAALTQESNALAMAEALRKKKFPAFVLGPSADRYYRVQVGPYADTESAHMAKRMIEKIGFKPIVKRW